MVTNWIARIRYAYHRHGAIGFIPLVWHNIAHYWKRYSRRIRTPATDPFDEEYGTDTRSIREISSLDVLDSPNAIYANRYEPTDHHIRSSLEKLGVDLRRFTFIDFGSGKGRALLIAATFPFKEVIGVEFSRELHETAIKNIARFPPNLIRSGAVRSVHSDAALFVLPASDLVCYFANPFGPPVLSQVVARLSSHTRRSGYWIIIIYMNPKHPEVFEQTRDFAVIDNSSDTLILTTVPDPEVTISAQR